MRTSHAASDNAFTRWILDRDGDWWGDEQERFRRYEGIAVMEHAQMIVFPTVMAVMAWTCPRGTAPWLLVALLAFIYPTILGSLYVAKRHVPFPEWTRKQVQWLALTAVPMIAAFAGLASKIGHFGPPTIAGVVVGMAAAIGIGMLTKARAANAQRSSTDLD